jgi:hypothetical protein
MHRIALAIALLGCGVDTAEDVACTAPAQPDLRWLSDNVFAPSCGGAACHGDAPSARGGLTLDAPPGRIHGELLAAAVEDAAQGSPRIAPGSCENSYLYRKLTGEGIGGTTRMPPDVPLCQAHIDAICAWIESGATAGGAP